MLMPIRGSRTYPKNPQNKSRLPQLSSSSSQSPQKVCLQRWLTMCPWCRTDIDCLIPNYGCTGLCFFGDLENRAQHAKWWEQMLILCELHLFSGAVVHLTPPEKWTLHIVVQKTWHMPKASIEMFEEPMDAPLWQLVALSAGTGGSMLAVGSVAGRDSVVFPGIYGHEKRWCVFKVVGRR